MDYICDCGKKYKYEGAFNKHKSKCFAINSLISNTKNVLLEINNQETQEEKTQEQETQEYNQNNRQDIQQQQPNTITTNENIVIEIDETTTTQEESKTEPNTENVYKNEISFMKWVLQFRFVNREFKKKAAHPVWMYNIRFVHEELLKTKRTQQQPNKQNKSKIIVKKDKKITKNK
jgi:hypothetical protein